MDSPSELKIRIPPQPELVTTEFEDDLVMNSLIYNKTTIDALKKLVTLVVGKIEDNSKTIKYNYTYDHERASKCDNILSLIMVPYARFEELRLCSKEEPKKAALHARDIFQWIRSLVCRLPILTTYRWINSCDLRKAIEFYNRFTACITCDNPSEVFLVLNANPIVETMRVSSSLPTLDVEFDECTRCTLSMTARELIDSIPYDGDEPVVLDRSTETQQLREMTDGKKGLIVDSICWCTDSMDSIDEKHDNITLFSLNPSYHSRCSFVDYENEGEHYSVAIQSLICRYVEIMVMRNGKGKSAHYDRNKQTYDLVLKTLVQIGTMLITVPGTDLTPLSFAKSGFYHNVSCLSDLGLSKKLDKLFDNTDFGLSLIIHPEDYLVARLTQNLPKAMIKWVLYCRSVYIFMLNNGIIEKNIRFGSYN